MPVYFSKPEDLSSGQHTRIDLWLSNIPKQLIRDCKIQKFNRRISADHAPILLSLELHKLNTRNIPIQRIKKILEEKQQSTYYTELEEAYKKWKNLILEDNPEELYEKTQDFYDILTKNIFEHCKEIFGTSKPQVEGKRGEYINDIQIKDNKETQG